MESDDPSWVELYRFTSFLDIQLKACEQSTFVKSGEDGFESFVIKFMINMSVVSELLYIKKSDIDSTSKIKFACCVCVMCMCVCICMYVQM